MPRVGIRLVLSLPHSNAEVATGLQVETLFGRTVAHYTMIHFSLQLYVDKSRVFTTSNVLVILYLFSVT